MALHLRFNSRVAGRYCTVAYLLSWSIGQFYKDLNDSEQQPDRFMPEPKYTAQPI